MARSFRFPILSEWAEHLQGVVLRSTMRDVANNKVHAETPLTSKDTTVDYFSAFYLARTLMNRGGAVKKVVPPSSLSFNQRPACYRQIRLLRDSLVDPAHPAYLKVIELWSEFNDPLFL